MRRSAGDPILQALLALGLLFLASTGPVDAQLRIGGHAVHAGSTFGGSSGFGLRAGAGLPLVPLDVAASGEYFFPDCAPAAKGCGLWGYGVDGNVRMVLPFVRPYVSGGLIYRRVDPGGGAETQTRSGFALGVGLGLSIRAIGAFVEGRYEFVRPERQAVWRAGVMLGFL